MKFILNSVSGDSYLSIIRKCNLSAFEEIIEGKVLTVIELKSLEQLIELSESIPSELILINPNRFDHGENKKLCEIDIYDDYRE
jgi:hypothetical protein